MRKGTNDFEMGESARMRMKRTLVVVGGTDWAVLPHTGTKARLFYREGSWLDTRGVIRLICGST